MKELRERIVVQLQLPRRLLRDRIATEDCGHAGFYSPGDSQCRVCETRGECEFLFANDDLLALRSMPTDDLLRALEVSALYVDACVTLNRHDRTECACDLCVWLAATQHILSARGDETGA